jgi:hypothetical protein
MKKILIISMITGLLFAGAAMAKDKEDGWIALFNGRNLDGWEQKGGDAKYEVEDGAIVGTSVPNTGNSFLCTEEKFEDFILEFEVLANPEMNSGVQFRSNSLKEYKDYRVHGYQCEIEDEGQHRDWFGGIYDEARRGWLFPKKSDKKHCLEFSRQGKEVWKNGEWNTIRIKCKGDRIRTWVNGEKRADFKDSMTDKGFIGLQVHGVGGREKPMSVKWRNIRLKKL